MSTSGQIGIVRFMVSTVDGKEVAHSYPLSGRPEDVLKMLAPIFAAWAAGFAKKLRMVPMEYPTVFYNMDHVVSLRFEPTGSEELDRAVQEATKTMGFRPSSSESG